MSLYIIAGVDDANRARVYRLDAENRQQATAVGCRLGLGAGATVVEEGFFTELERQGCPSPGIMEDAIDLGRVDASTAPTAPGDDDDDIPDAA